MKASLKKPPPNDPLVDDTPPPYEETIQPQVPPLDPSRHAGLPHSSTVTTDECAAHLKFLGALADLRDSVATHNGLFGINDSSADKFPDFTNDARARIREKRWAVYTARAVERYSAWWNTLPDYGNRPTIETIQTREYDRLTVCETQVLWDESYMPPLGKWLLLLD